MSAAVFACARSPSTPSQSSQDLLQPSQHRGLCPGLRAGPLTSPTSTKLEYASETSCKPQQLSSLFWLPWPMCCKMISENTRRPLEVMLQGSAPHTGTNQAQPTAPITAKPCGDLEGTNGAAITGKGAEQAGAPGKVGRGEEKVTSVPEPGISQPSILRPAICVPARALPGKLPDGCICAELISPPSLPSATLP